jgi:phospholipase C
VGRILDQIEHLIVVMLENRSLDHLCGWLYSDSAPGVVLPAGGPSSFDGVNPGLWNPSNASFFLGEPPDQVFVTRGTSNTTVPNPNPEEGFEHITFQIYGPEGEVPAPRWPMQGFLVDYKNVNSSDPNQLMECYSPDQVPALSALARSFAISDRWFSSAPCETWPNRAFVHAGTANGNVDNQTIPNPFDWNVPTIFDVLSKMGLSWTVYCDTLVTPSLTRSMFPGLWNPLLDGHFRGFSAFRDACASGTLPRYSFLEPSFFVQPNDMHPPHDVASGDAFLFEIWRAVSTSPSWPGILLVITFDEHGGCYDHVLPPSNAKPPDAASSRGDKGFTFDRFGVRVPTILVSPYIEPGTVFRAGEADSATPFDHTSILATLREWLEIPDSLMLPGARIAAAPHLGSVLTRSSPRADLPTIPAPTSRTPRTQANLAHPVSNDQKNLLAVSAVRLGGDPKSVLQSVQTVQDAVDYFKQHPSLAAS